LWRYVPDFDCKSTTEPRLAFHICTAAMSQTDSVCLGSLKKQLIVPGDVTSHVTTELFVTQAPTDVKLIDTDCGI
jgi:hypothetical protein